MTAQLHAALEYLKRGFSVLPLIPNDKKPVGRWRRWQKAPMSPDIAALWWEGALQPTPGIGIITGRASQGLTVLDVEPEHVAYVKHKVGFPKTPIVHTARGGVHIYCKGDNRCSKLIIGDRRVGDIRGNGGYVVAPPSSIRSSAYRWTRDFDWSDLEDAPEWAQARRTRERVAPPLVGFRQPVGRLLAELSSSILYALDGYTGNWSSSERDFRVMCECVHRHGTRLPGPHRAGRRA